MSEREWLRWWVILNGEAIKMNRFLSILNWLKQAFLTAAMATSVTISLGSLNVVSRRKMRRRSVWVPSLFLLRFRLTPGYDDDDDKWQKAEINRPIYVYLYVFRNHLSRVSHNKTFAKNKTLPKKKKTTKTFRDPVSSFPGRKSETKMKRRRHEWNTHAS